LDVGQVQIVGKILEVLQVYYSTDQNLEAAKKISSRFFHKQLRRPYTEAGVESSLRVVLRIEGSKAIAILAGNHDQIKRFLLKV
jgi:hypothetical protein